MKPVPFINADEESFSKNKAEDKIVSTLNLQFVKKADTDSFTKFNDDTSKK
jgi:hypothetical protein